MKNTFKKTIIVCFAIIICVYFFAKINLVKLSSSQFNSLMQNEEVYYQLFITMLYPYINEAVADYYSEYMTSSPHAAPYDYRFTSIEKQYGLTYSYIIQVEVHPYVGPHLTVGKDKMTFKIKLNGVQLEKFEHLESYELPPHYQEILKKNLP